MCRDAEQDALLVAGSRGVDSLLPEQSAMIPTMKLRWLETDFDEYGNWRRTKHLQQWFSPDGFLSNKDGEWRDIEVETEK
jgi:hypothetical protein